MYCRVDGGIISVDATTGDRNKGLTMTIADKIDEVKRRIERLRFDLAVQEELLTTLQEIRRSENLGSVTTTRRVPSNGSHKPLVKGSFASSIEKILREADNPMSIDDLADKLTEEGLTSDSPRGMKPTISAALSRRKDLFERVERGVFRLKKKENLF